MLLVNKEQMENLNDKDQYEYMHIQINNLINIK